MSTHAIADSLTDSRERLRRSYEGFSITPGESLYIERHLRRTLRTLRHLPDAPGRGALLASMTAERIQQTIDGDLASVPFAVGANNHTGSRLTAHAGQMQTVMRHLQQRQLFFIDSRTTDETVAYAVARKIGVKSAQRKVFLDVKPGRDFARRQLTQLASLAEQGQPAIAIGHPKEDTLRALEEMLPEFERRGIRIVRVSEFLE